MKGETIHSILAWTTTKEQSQLLGTTCSVGGYLERFVHSLLSTVPYTPMNKYTPPLLPLTSTSPNTKLKQHYYHAAMKICLRPILVQNYNLHEFFQYSNHRFASRQGRASQAKFNATFHVICQPQNWIRLLGYTSLHQTIIFVNSNLKDASKWFKSVLQVKIHT